MGKKTQQKAEKQVEYELRWQASLYKGTLEAETKQAANDIRLIDETNIRKLNAYSHLFIRDPKDCPSPKSRDPNKRLVRLVRHVFNKYPVPNFFYDIWTGPRANTLPLIPGHVSHASRVVFFEQCYLCVAQGGSLYKEHLRSYMTKSEVHRFLTAPCGSLAEAAWFSIPSSIKEVRPGLAITIARTKIQQRFIDPFWTGVARWIVLNPPPKNSVAELNDVIDYIISRKQENTDYQLKGTYKSIEKRTLNWHRDLARMKNNGGGSWHGHPLYDSEYTTGKDETLVNWKLRQIKTGNELALEGNKMRHCVAGYKSSCVAGQTSIWSLTRNNTRVLTIELHNDGSIYQARGLANRKARPEELSVLRVWAKNNGLYLGSYL